MSDVAAVPLHDWTRVRPGAYHDFHTAWLVYLRRDLKRLLPKDYYADIQTVVHFDPPETDEPEWREADVLGLRREPGGRSGGGACRRAGWRSPKPRRSRVWGSSRRPAAGAASASATSAGTG